MSKQEDVRTSLLTVYNDKALDAAFLKGLLIGILSTSLFILFGYWIFFK